ncbi:hypothetical protein BKG71_23530 [Mycobacteroides chelonae]|uniref:DUF4192 family protein n=1 Tax=Mycobacteroides chelonae TaxID=1774 RepID=UPI0008A9581D|nr:DUF4192 family protein [Mycobacteroides chelonae]OHT95649.1 hypothetical protein BKG71_23530 [Mycobacteroides chelonae]
MYAIKARSSMVESIPALLGYVPVKSFIFILLDGNADVAAVLRVPLAEAGECVSRIVGMTARQGVVSAAIVIVDSDAAVGEHGSLIREFETALARADVRVFHAIVVDRVDAGGHWRCGDGCGAGGALGDPASSPLAAEAVLIGRPIYKSRDDLVALVAVDESRSSTLAAAVRGISGHIDGDQAVSRAIEAANQLADGATVDDAVLVCVAASLGD